MSKTPMPPKVDHRRAIADRNAAGILDALERLADRGAPVTMAALAAEAGVSRPTLYAHYKTMQDVVAAATERVVHASAATIAAAAPQDGPADAALQRMLEASWGQLGKIQGLVRVALEHQATGSVHQTHHALMAPLQDLIERGQRDGVFRADLPAAWLQTMYFQLVHGAEEHAAAHGISRDEALDLLRASARDVFLTR